jgi:hypothetical protein
MWSASITPTSFPALQRHLERHGFPMVRVSQARDESMAATRLDPKHPWVRWARRRSSARPEPRCGAAEPRRLAAERRLQRCPRPADRLDPALVRVVQPARAERALLMPVAREGIRLMAGLMWDLGEVRGRVPAA